MAKAKKQSRAVAKPYNPHESLIIQGGVIFIIVSAIAIFAYTYATYGIK